MEQLIKNLEPRNLAESSINHYTRHIGYLAKLFSPTKVYNSNEFLTVSYDKIMEHLNTLSAPSKRSHLASICVALNPTKDINQIAENDKASYEKYKPQVWELNEAYLKEKKTQQFTEKEQKNWVEWDKIQEVRDEYYDNLKKLGYKVASAPEKPNFELVKKYLVSALYTYNPPRRLEYAEMERITHNNYIKLNRDIREANNYIVSVNKRKKKYFSFSKVKSKDPNEPVIIVNIGKELNEAINIWYHITPGVPSFLVNSELEPMSKNTLSKFLTYKVFKATGKQLSTNMLRHIYLSTVYAGDKGITFKEELAKKMNHSVHTMEHIYVKKPCPCNSCLKAQSCDIVNIVPENLPQVNADGKFTNLNNNIVKKTNNKPNGVTINFM